MAHGQAVAFGSVASRRRRVFSVPAEIGEKCPFTAANRVYRMVSAPDHSRRPGVDGYVDSRTTYDPGKFPERATEFTGNVGIAGSGPPEARVNDGLQRHDSSTKGPSVK